MNRKLIEKTGFAAEEIKKIYESKKGSTHWDKKVGVVLGSGLSDLLDDPDCLDIPYSTITAFPQSSVAGHKNVLKITDTSIIFCGRFHYYEGFAMEEVVLPTFLLHALGVKKMVVTNAAGAVNAEFQPGDFVIINDHINMMGNNPLIGPNDDTVGPRFPDMSQAYNRKLSAYFEKAYQTVNPKDSRLQHGVYIGLTGPTYETPAEVRMLRTLGADMVGMSTVPEVIAANYLGMKVAGMSYITNMATGILDQPLSHDEVLDTGRKVKKDLSLVLKEAVKGIYEG